jgi:hypothetical protein
VFARRLLALPPLVVGDDARQSCGLPSGKRRVFCRDEPILWSVASGDLQMHGGVMTEFTPHVWLSTYREQRGGGEGFAAHGAEWRITNMERSPGNPLVTAAFWPIASIVEIREF